MKVYKEGELLKEAGLCWEPDKGHVYVNISENTCVYLKESTIFRNHCASGPYDKPVSFFPPEFVT